MANDSKAVGYFAFNLTTQVEITEAMAKAITNTDTVYVLEKEGKYYLIQKQVIETDIEKGSMPFNIGFFGLSGQAGQGARDIMENTTAIMIALKQQSISVELDNAEFHLYKTKEETENHKAGASALAAICDVAGVEVPKVKPAARSGKVNLAGLL